MLVLVTDSHRLRARSLADIVQAAVEGGVTAVQLRDKAASHDELLRAAALLRDAIAGKAQLFINSDVDAAHRARRRRACICRKTDRHRRRPRASGRPSIPISRAVHSIEAAVRAERERVDIVQAGTLFATASKPGTKPLGLHGLRAICDAVRIPVIAIGGITPQNAADAVAAGAAGVAVIGAIFDAEDPARAARALRTAISAAATVR